MMKIHIAAILAGTMLSSVALAQNYSAPYFSSLTLGTPLAVTSGGTGTATPSLVAGTNITISGSWPSQTINSTGGGSPGGSNGQIQYDNAGSFGGFTVSGDATLNTATGAITVTKSGGVAFGSAAFDNVGTSGATIPLLNGQNTWATSGPNWATFTTLYQGDLYNLGGLPTSSMDAHLAAGAVSMAQALVGAIDVPTSAVYSTFQNNGVAGYARASAANQPAVGVFGAGMVGGANAAAWGLNTLVTNSPTIISTTQTGSHANTLYSIEADVNIFQLPGGGSPVGHARGLAIFGGAEARMTDQYGIEVGSLSQANASTVYWDAGIVIDEAPNTAGILIGPKGTGSTSLPSQSLAFRSWNASSASLTAYVYTDLNGNLSFLPAAGTSGQSTFAGAVNTGALGATSATQYNGISLSNGTNFAAILSGYGAGNDGGTLALQTGGVAKSLISGNTGTTSYINNGAGLNIGGTAAAPAGSLVLGTPLTVANGGTGTATPALVAGTDVTITGSWPDQTINVSLGAGLTSSGGSATLDLNHINTFTGQQNAAQQTASGSTIAWNLNTQQSYQVTLTGGSTNTLSNPTNMVAGGTYVLELIQGGSGANIISTWGSDYKFPGGTKPTLSTAVNAVDFITCSSDGTHMFCVWQGNFQ